jgi:hypothetical protein
VDQPVNRKVTYLHMTVQEIERFVPHCPFALAFYLLRLVLEAYDGQAT